MWILKAIGWLMLRVVDLATYAAGMIEFFRRYFRTLKKTKKKEVE